MSKSDFTYQHGFLVDHVLADVPLAAVDGILLISISPTNTASFSYSPANSAFSAQWATAGGSYSAGLDRIDGLVAHSSNPLDGAHPFSITLDRGPRGSANRPRIHVYIGIRPSGGTPDDGGWTGQGSPPPPPPVQP